MQRFLDTKLVLTEKEVERHLIGSLHRDEVEMGDNPTVVFEATTDGIQCTITSKDVEDIP